MSYRIRGLCLMVALLLLSGCTPLLRQATWEQLEPSSYKFEDRNLRVLFKIEGKQFLWHFHNKQTQPLVIDQQGAFFVVEDDIESYSLWGSTKSAKNQIPAIQVKGDGYVAMNYPVLFRSALYPFPLGKGKEVILYFNARWGEKATAYELRFPSKPKPKPEPKSKPKPKPEPEPVK